MFDEFLLNLSPCPLFCQLDGPGRMLKDENRLEPCQVGKEPATARIHLQGVLLHLQEFESFDPAFFIKAVCPILTEELFDLFRRPMKDHFNIPISRFPGILKDLSSFSLKALAEFIP